MGNNQVVELRENVIDSMQQYEVQLRDAGMNVEAQQINQKIDEFCQGLFQVLFTGVFSAGKSTTLNALMHQDLLYVSINPATPVITRIVNGNDSNVAVVTYRDERPDRTLSIEELSAEFRLEAENPEKFREIKYVTIQRKLPTETVIFVDSPGLQNTDIDTAIAYDFASKADAIVFLMNATKAMDMYERNYIIKNFEGRCLDNVYFVINWYNLVSPLEEEEFQQKLLFDLKGVFTDANGVFNEELYNSRVFCVDAFTSACARTGCPKVLRKGTKMVEEIVPIEEDKYTGIPEFEESLYGFLQSSDKDIAGYRGYLPKMASMYKSTAQTVDQFIKDSGRTLEELERECAKQKEAIKEVTGIIDGLNRSFHNTTCQIMVNAQDAYNSFVTSAMNNWQSYFETCNVNFGMKEIGKLTALKTKHKFKDIFSKKSSLITDKEAIELARDEEFKKILQPISNAIEEYISLEAEKMKDMILADCDVAFINLKKEVEVYVQKISEIDMHGIDLIEIIDAIKGSHVNDSMVNNDFDLTQVLISALYFTNFDDAIDGIVGGKTPWNVFLKKTLTTQIKEFVIALVVDLFTGIGWVYYAVRAVWGIITLNKNSGEYGKKMVMASKEMTIQELMDNKDEFAAKMKLKFVDIADKNCNDFTKEFKEQLLQKNKQLELLIEKLEQKGFDAEQEIARLEGIKEELIRIFNVYAGYVGERARTEEEILDYAVEFSTGLK